MYVIEIQNSNFCKSTDELFTKDISDRFLVLTVFTMPITAIVTPSGAKIHDFQTVANNAITANTIIIEPITMFAVCK